MTRSTCDSGRLGSLGTPECSLSGVAGERVHGADLAFQFRRAKAGEKESPVSCDFVGLVATIVSPFRRAGFSLLDNGKLRLSKIGDVKIVLHRPVTGRCKTLTIRRDVSATGTLAFPEVEPKPLEPTPERCRR